MCVCVCVLCRGEPRGSLAGTCHGLHIQTLRVENTDGGELSVAINQSIKDPHKATHGQAEADPSTATGGLCVLPKSVSLVLLTSLYNKENTGG